MLDVGARALTFLGVVVAAATLASCTPPPVPSQHVVADARCADAALVWGRGSSAPVAGGTFALAARRFLANTARTAPDLVVDALELGDLDGDGVADDGGYPAVAPGEFVGLDTRADPARELVLIGGYNASTHVGAGEFVHVLSTLRERCPEQVFVVGGESQGADAVMKGLARLPGELLDAVAAVHVFGDPGFVVGPWMVAPRTVIPSGHGLLGPRWPYVPAGLEERTTSWCAQYDWLCTGQFWFGLLDLLEECEDRPDLVVCSRRHIDYTRWAIDPAMERAAASVTAARS